MKKYDYELSSTPDGEAGDELALSYVCPASVVLEFGPAYGRMTQYLKETLNCQVYIVELDATSYEHAMKYADEGVCGDILDFEWFERFKDVTFDYIIFADVLEHLNDPRAALEKAVQLLKYDGKLVVSVPNIAHSAVILSLINNQFNYTKLGLLDDTHVRFFTYNSLVEMLDYCGFIPIVENASISTPEYTEFKVSYSDINGNTDVIENKEYGHVYHFVFCCINKETYYENKEKYQIKRIPNTKSNTYCQIYYDTGNGFNKDEVAMMPMILDGSQFSLMISPGPNVIRMRFDPVEGKKCLIRGVEIITDIGIVSYSSTNGIKSGDSILFDTIDPQITVNLEGLAQSHVKISGEIWTFRLHNIAVFEQIKQALYDYHNKNDELTLLLDRERMLLSRLQNESQRIVSITNDYEGRIANLDAYRHMYESIASSEFWKMTKPLRIVVNALKLVCRKTPGVSLFYKYLHYAKTAGFKSANKKTARYFQNKSTLNSLEANFRLSEADRQAQENTVFSKAIKISIITPLYNTPLGFLKEMIESVQAQTYPDWELCLADGSDTTHHKVMKACMKFAKKDKRIKYRKLNENFGISGNSNEAIRMASGDYLGLLDHDDLLHPSALYEAMKPICEKNADFVYTDEATFEGSTNNLVNVHFKPDYAIDNLRAGCYICHFSVFSKSLVENNEMFRSEYDGSQDHDLFLRITRKTKKVYHIPKLLYYWRQHPNSAAADVNTTKPYAIEAGKNAVKDDIKAHGMSASVDSSRVSPTLYRIDYDLIERPMVSIIIPSKDNVSVLKTCISSILDKSTYENYEIIIAENNSQEEATFDYYMELEANSNIKVVRWLEQRFNYSDINNFAVQSAKGEQLLFLNNDIEIITHRWIEEMLMYSQRDDVGAVGAKLYYPDDTIQHAGVILGLGSDRIAGHAFYGLPRNEIGYMGKLWVSQNMSAVTGACMMVAKSVFDKVGGFSPIFSNSFNDIDLCMKIRHAGYLIVWTPYAEAYHYESKTRGYHTATERQRLFEHEVSLFKSIWAKELEAGDPYYNVNLSLDKSDYSFI